MNDPSTTPVDIEEQRAWIIDHKDTMAMSWSQLAKRTGIAQGTLSQFASARGYAGDELKVAEQVARYRQLLASQASIEVDVPEIPVFFETETSRTLETMLIFAQRGQMIAAALEAGLGKTRAARHFQVCYPNVVHVELRKSAANVNNMQIMVLKAMGEKNPVGSPLKMSDRICEMFSKLGQPLLILDEAQHLSENSIEEVRGWYDDIGLGVAFFGNVGVLQKLQRYPQLYSRLSMKTQRNLPLNSDVAALADAWGIFDEAQRNQLLKICMTLGGLRNGTMALQLATMIAAADRKPLEVGHLQDAWAQLSSRTVLG